MASNLLELEVAYADSTEQCVLPLTMLSGSTVAQAIVQSGILSLKPSLNLTQHKVGIFGRPVQLDDLVHNGDRIEIYRPLLIDPKQARRRRAVSAKTPSKPLISR